MSKRKRLFWYSILGLLLVIQVYPLSKPEVKAHNPNDIFNHVKVAGDIKIMIKTACYDCHSYEVTFPWYSNVAPVKWQIYSDINDGRAKLNFSKWALMDKADQADALDNIASEVDGNDMPLQIYPIMHPKAKLTKVQRKKIVDWANNYLDGLFDD